MPANRIGDPLNRTAITLGVLVTLAVVLRFLARWRSKADFAADDVLIAISVLPFNPEMLFTDHCINLWGYYWGVTAANLGIDVIMLLLPLHMVWDLKMPIRQKFLLSDIFMLGSV